MTASNNPRDEVMAFLATITRPGFDITSFSDDTNLIDEGAIDSFALIQVIFFLEEEHGLNLQAAGIDPADLISVDGIMTTIGQARTQ
jgi:acyl carrier protein